ncbi:ABC transporter substrate-binding protein [Variovorax humicola]|uniref:ABC transporter substrate-binding protein n=1 Tax=Variovorax humicola TaxID=1769758 RepID=A0ABU8VUS2_9BURK
MMDRRKLIGAMAAFSATLAARAQVPGRIYRIGYLGNTSPQYDTPAETRIMNGLVVRLRELGFSEGENTVIERRFADGRNERYVDFAAEMVKLNVDTVVAGNVAGVRAVLSASRTMPIVTTTGDPVQAGFAASLAHPGGQVTGMANLGTELIPKQLELLKAAVPTARQIAIARCPDCLLKAGVSAAEVDALTVEFEEGARSLGLKLRHLNVNAKDDFDAVAAGLRREPPDALLIGPTQINQVLRDEWVALAGEMRLPTLALYPGFGAMLSYGADFVAIYRRAAEFVARILNGARPGDLPIEQPTKLEFVVNLKVAKSIGVTVPPALLLRADDVIR